MNHYRVALQVDPERVDAAFGLGVSYLHSGQPGDAVNYLRVAFRRAPWAPRVNYYLGEAYRLSGNNRKAEIHLRKTLNWDRSAGWRELAKLALGKLVTTSASSGGRDPGRVLPKALPKSGRLRDHETTLIQASN